ncbi:cbb3-type cytochrome oxidase assembly protein CcoS [Pseudomonas sp. NPDC007930]|uniref:cbb3-type cytochrome oxidase assembly protein CcoS n=1 Tax=Pseudomonas sp. NPDC007930 TaxID=3364417 RepID=UPI0036E9F85E
MAALYWLIPAAVLIVGMALWLFFWAVGSGQYDDLDSPARRILFDDDDPAHHAAAKPAERRHDEP